MESINISSYTPQWDELDTHHPLTLTTVDSFSKKSLSKLGKLALFIPGIDIGRKLYRARNLEDRKAVFELSLRAISLPLWATHISLRSVAFFGLLSVALTVSSIVFATLFLTIELGIEIYRMACLLKFRYQLHKGDESLPKGTPLIERQLSWLHKTYFSTTLDRNEAYIQQRALARMVRPWMIPRIHQTLLDNRLENRDKKLIATIDEQIKKSMIVRAIGILVIATTAIAFFGLLISPGMPALVPLIIGYSGYAIELIRLLAPVSFLNHQGYNWSWSAHWRK